MGADRRGGGVFVFIDPFFVVPLGKPCPVTDPHTAMPRHKKSTTNNNSRVAFTERYSKYVLQRAKTFTSKFEEMKVIGEVRSFFSYK